ncbi:MAG: NADH-quinone oxidoreductase subunit M [Candidatus Krumholzibacteria bacterium]|jgi:NADH-quinone oxidoreductase subunit M|nr:NADH-quinone oxidoreductase subunit M [Candidatus Krumholzibacteria bacterium]
MPGHVLSWITFFPLIGAAVLLLIPSGKDRWIKGVATAATLLPLWWAVKLFQRFDRVFDGKHLEQFQFTEGPYLWIKSFNISYFMGVDGISISMVLLTTLVGAVAVVASFGIQKQLKAYFALFLLLETGMLGVFCSLDFFLFYVFWEVMLLPMYFLIGIWGGPRKVYAAIKFFLYTLFGSVFMLLAMLFLYYQAGKTFNMVEIMQASKGLAIGVQTLLWFALYIGFAIKVPAFPFHTWLPDAHVEAPTAISVILAGVLLKMGTYGLLRINFTMLPEATYKFAWFLALIGTINIIYGALCAMAQKDLKKLVAYSSISHMGFVMLGMASLTPQGINGAVLQMFNHGTITSMLFLLVGVVYDRAHHREIEGFGGLANRVPAFTGFTALAFFASLGLPGLSGFIGEILCFMGGFKTFPIYTAISVSGVVLGAAYLLWTFQRVFLGELNTKYETLTDMNVREWVTLVPLAVIVIVLGVWPMPLLDLIQDTLNFLVTHVTPATAIAGF